jgi:acyl-CoA-binding protein
MVFTNNLLKVLFIFKCTGDCNVTLNENADMKEKIKFKYWIKNKGLSKEIAEKKYNDLIKSINSKL